MAVLRFNRDRVLKPNITLKSDIARRCTDEEAAMLRALLDGTSAQFWLLYMGVQQIEHNSPEFPILRQAFVDTVGEARAEAILAPSQVA